MDSFVLYIFMSVPLFPSVLANCALLVGGVHDALARFLVWYPSPFVSHSLNF